MLHAYFLWSTCAIHSDLILTTTYIRWAILYLYILKDIWHETCLSRTFPSCSCSITLISHPIFSPTPLPCWQHSTYNSEPKILPTIFNEMPHWDFKFNLDKAVELHFKSAPSVEFMFPKCTVSFMNVWMLHNASSTGENRFCLFI